MRQPAHPLRRQHMGLPPSLLLQVLRPHQLTIPAQYRLSLHQDSPLSTRQIIPLPRLVRFPRTSPQRRVHPKLQRSLPPPHQHQAQRCFQHLLLQACALGACAPHRCHKRCVTKVTRQCPHARLSNLQHRTHRQAHLQARRQARLQHARTATTRRASSGIRTTMAPISSRAASKTSHRRRTAAPSAVATKSATSGRTGRAAAGKEPAGSRATARDGRCRTTVMLARSVADRLMSHLSTTTASARTVGMQQTSSRARTTRVLTLSRVE